MLKSVASSRSQTPGSQTPRRSAAPEEDEFAFASPLVSTELQQRLLELSEGGEHVKKDAFLHSVEILESDRRKTAIQAREQALHIILNVVTMKHEPNLVSANLYAAITAAYQTSRSELESILSLQLLVVLFTFIVDASHSAQDDAMERTKKLLPVMLERARLAETPVGSRAAASTAFAVLQFFINSGGSAFGVDDVAGDLLLIAESTKSSDTPAVVASLSGVALLCVLMTPKTSRAFAEDILPSIAQLLSQPQPEIRAAAARLCGVLFEQCPDEPVEGIDELIEALEAVQRESAKRTAKRDKKSQKSVVRDALATIRGERSGILAHVHLSGQRSMRVNSWAALVLLYHLKWVFGPGLQSQLATNPFVVAIVQDVDDSTDSEEGSSVSSTVAEPDRPSELPSKARRELNIRKSRLDKMEARELSR